jgi:heme exporter protein C
MSSETTMDETMLITMLIMTLGFWAYSIAIAMVRVRSIILERERSSNWVRDLVRGES